MIKNVRENSKGRNALAPSPSASRKASEKRNISYGTRRTTYLQYLKW